MLHFAKQKADQAEIIHMHVKAGSLCGVDAGLFEMGPAVSRRGGGILDTIRISDSVSYALDVPILQCVLLVGGIPRMRFEKRRLRR